MEQEHKEDDIRYLKQKVDSGVDFLTTQMFFDNDIHYNFLYRIREAGITVPVLPGIMPITSLCSDEAKPGTFRNSISEKISCNIRSLRKFSGCDEAGRNCLCNRSDY